MTLLNFFKSPWLVVKLKLEIEHKNRQIGGHKAEQTKRSKICESCRYHPNFVCGDHKVEEYYKEEE